MQELFARSIAGLFGGQGTSSLAEEMAKLYIQHGKDLDIFLRISNEVFGFDITQDQFDPQTCFLPLVFLSQVSHYYVLSLQYGQFHAPFEGTQISSSSCWP
jgi:hypothetical protein